ncbi:hypothetical protein SCE1572_38815 [Sorangium cellulosum So0157-2]|uniref:Uncharacterized protein n=1 Tax=Sorangium cellulosum So0157-2 TaxID=1254432 RepID=S4Y671_SORCE|nr:hypothetical protein SCE1572_38815 [Sorangium cellulosum So0157-2]
MAPADRAGVVDEQRGVAAQPWTRVHTDPKIRSVAAAALPGDAAGR